MKRISILIAFAVITGLTLQSCKTTSLAPAYNAGIVADVKLGQQLTVDLYDQAIKNPDKHFAVSDSLYAMVEGQIAAIERKCEARPISIGRTAILKIISNLELKFKEYRDKHRKAKDGLSNEELSLNKNYLLPHWKSLLNAEGYLK